MGDAPLKRKLTFRRLSGLDRSGPPPPMTLADAPLNPWTIPNAIGFVRLALIPVFLWLAFAHDDGTSGYAAAVFAVIAWSDYADGIAARVTVGRRTLADGEVEVQLRRGREARAVPLEGAAQAVADLWQSAP